MDKRHRSAGPAAATGSDRAQAPSAAGASGPDNSRVASELRGATPAATDLQQGGVLARMEAAFGADFSSVEISTGEHAGGLGAEAVTTGESIDFAPGRYQPETQKGAELLGHELAHVVQQRQGRVPVTAQFKGSDVNVDEALEREADAAGAKAAAGKDPGLGAAGPSAGAGVAQMDHKQVRNNSQVIDLHEDEDAYVHYSYDLVKNGSQHNKKDNDHLTVENSLATLLATQRMDKDGVGAFRDTRGEKHKGQHNQLLNAYGFTGVDNINFRPKENQQGTSAISNTLDPDQSQRKATGNKRKDAASDAVAVDESLSLETFSSWLEALMKQVGVDDDLSKAILASMETVRKRMGVAAADLYLNGTQKAEFAKFVLLAVGLSGWAKANGPITVPAPLRGLVQAKSVIRIKKADFDDQAFKAGLSNEVYQEIKAKVDDDKTWTKTEGEPNYTAVQTFLIERHWDTIKGWVINPPH